MLLACRVRQLEAAALNGELLVLPAFEAKSCRQPACADGIAEGLAAARGPKELVTAMFKNGSLDVFRECFLWVLLYGGLRVCFPHNLTAWACGLLLDGRAVAADVCDVTDMPVSRMGCLRRRGCSLHINIRWGHAVQGASRCRTESAELPEQLKLHSHGGCLCASSTFLFLLAHHRLPEGAALLDRLQALVHTQLILYSALCERHGALVHRAQVHAGVL